MGHRSPEAYDGPEPKWHESRVLRASDPYPVIPKSVPIVPATHGRFASEFEVESARRAQQQRRAERALTKAGGRERRNRHVAPRRTADRDSRMDALRQEMEVRQLKRELGVLRDQTWSVESRIVLWRNVRWLCAGHAFGLVLVAAMT